MSVWASRVRVDGHNGLQFKALQLDEGSRGPNVVRAPKFICASGNDVEKSLGKSKRKAKKKRKNKSGGEMNQESQQMAPMGSKVSRVHSAAAHLSSVQLGNYIVYSSEKKINRLAKVNVSEEAGVGVSKPERSRRTKSAPVSGKQKQRSFRPSALKKSIRCERKRLWEEHNPSNSLPQLWDLFNMLEERQHLTCPQNHIGSFTALENLFVSLKFKRYLPVKIERKVSDEVILYRNPVLISSSDAGINEYITKHSHHLSDKIDQRIHSNRTPWILQGVSNILSDELDLLVTALLSKLQLLQKRLKEHDPFKVRARMRYVLGSRQVLKGMKAGRVKVLIVSPDIEPILPLQEMINTILSAAKSQNIPIVFALSLKMLRTVLALPAGAKPSCVGIYSTDGAHEEYRELMTHLPQSKQQFSELISLK